MKVRVINAKELSRDDRSNWVGLQESDPTLCSPYFCPDFTMAVAAVRDDVRIGIIEEDGLVAGFFPFQRERFGVGKPVGGIMSDYHGVVMRAGFQLDVAELIQRCKLAIWDFNHLPVSQTIFQKFLIRTAASPRIDLSCGYKAYRRGRRQAGSEQIKRVDGLERKFERDIGSLRFEAQVCDTEVLHTLMDWKSAQYRQGGGRDIFRFAWARDLLERIHSMQGLSFCGVLSALYVGDELVAVHFGMRSRTVWHYWFPAYNMKFAKYSPGLILLLKMVAVSEGWGICAIDLGKGDALYKQRLANDATLLGEGSVEIPALVVTMRKCGLAARHAIAQTPLAPLARRLRLLRRRV